MNIIPDEVAKAVSDVVWSEADKIGYLTCTKPQSAAFMEALVQMPNVGGVLLNYMQRAVVKTYIKDSILHDYTDKMKASKVPNLETLRDWCRTALAIPDLEVLENIDKPWTKISVFSSIAARTYVVVVDGSFKQWGTALQKALTYMVDKPFATRIGFTVRLGLSLYCKGTPISRIERVELYKALSFIGGIYRLYGEN